MVHQPSPLSVSSRSGSPGARKRNMHA
jgi:hypothetical protein